MVQLFFTLNGKNELAISADDVDLLPSQPTLQLVQVTTVGSSCQPFNRSAPFKKFSGSWCSVVPSSTGQNFHFGNSRKRNRITP